jgi:DNA helicase IV
MRLPNTSQISEEQESVYLDAPLDKHIIVTGPPGTGKTVIAFLRARTLANAGKKNGHTPVVIMYNRVLRRYTENASQREFVVRTMNSWVQKWWNSLGVKGLQYGQRFNLDCPFDEKDEAKELGARWNRYQKKWWIDGDSLREESEEFERWSPTADIPKIDDDQFAFDWDLMSRMVLGEMGDGTINSKNLNWGQLIIDEGQDFSPDMYEFFRSLSDFCFENDANPPVVTVFADENQRLQEHRNSTIEEIRRQLEVSQDHSYTLSRNYRNSKPIAQLAAHFYVGLATGKPDLPSQKGRTPVLFRGKALDSTIDYICRYARNNDNEEVGVIVENNRIRKKVVNKIRNRLKDLDEIVVQTYAAGDPECGDDRELVFDEPGVITVVNSASCKGLEFDAVFIPELQRWRNDPNEIDNFKMRLYVMISRARKFVSLMYSNEGGGKPDFLKLLPAVDGKTLESVNGK